jgi:hypothetical protein
MSKLIAIRLPESLVDRMKAEGSQTRIIRDLLESRYGRASDVGNEKKDIGAGSGRVNVQSNVCSECGALNGNHFRSCKR